MSFFIFIHQIDIINYLLFYKYYVYFTTRLIPLILAILFLLFSLQGFPVSLFEQKQYWMIDFPFLF